MRMTQISTSLGASGSHRELHVLTTDGDLHCNNSRNMLQGTPRANADIFKSLSEGKMWVCPYLASSISSIQYDKCFSRVDVYCVLIHPSIFSKTINTGRKKLENSLNLGFPRLQLTYEFNPHLLLPLVVLNLRS